jgi:surfeit locus 1 family protein
MTDPAARPRSRAALMALAAFAVTAFAAFAALGTWQLFRLEWKLNLIDRVEHRVHASPVPAPGPAQWPHVNAADDEYKHVQLAGTFLDSLATPVQASTELGFGYWLLTPLRSNDGSMVLVNRGFVPVDDLPAAIAAGKHESGPVTVTGLLRMSEPGGAFLHHNDPAGHRWYSRDVRAIAQARGLARVAPYFVDADAAPAESSAAVQGWPVGGMTVVSFRNNHLAYALTWYALALMVAGAAFWAVREERRAAAGSRNPDGAYGNREGHR